jgi:2-oxoisovalerate dehydrogenase E2 component (dihydrolipoyl transacylase)
VTQLKQFKLPDVGEGLTEADIVRWHVKAGDEVTVNQTIVEIETAKALVELPCPFEGVVAGLLVGEGETVPVGTPIISVDVDGDAGAAATVEPDTERLPQAASTPAPAEPAVGGVPSGPGASPAGTPSPLAGRSIEDLVPSPPAEGGVEPGMHGSPARKQERQPVLVGYGVKLGTTTRRPRKPAAAGSGPAQARASSAAPAAARPQPAQPVATVLAKPPVRKLARELGVDLASVAGTGPTGSVTRSDVQAAADAAAADVGDRYDAGPGMAGAARPAVFGPSTTAGAAAREERIPVRGVRKHTAAAVVASAFTAPHVTEFLQIDMTATMEAVARVRDLPEFADVRVSPLLFVAKALLIAVARNPVINSSWDDAAQEIVVKRYVHLGIAAATGRGLIVPNIKDAHTLPLPALARALSALAETARTGRTAVTDLQGGTITITNVGVFGVDSGTPILTPGEAAIVAFGQVRDLPWVHRGELAVRKVCTLSFSFDHRIVDGDLGSAVLRDVGAMLADPVRMLAWG